MLTLLSVVVGSNYNRNQEESSSPIMDYTLSWDGTSNLLKVNLHYTCQSKDSSILYFGQPDFGGQEDIFNILKNVSVGSGDSLKIYPKERKLLIKHQGNEKTKTLSYSIDGSLAYDKSEAQSVDKVVDERFRPIIRPNHLYLFGESYLMYFESDQEIEHLIHWENYPKNMDCFNSYDLDNNPSTISKTSYYELSNSISIISTDIAINSVTIKDVPHTFVTPKKDKTISEIFNKKTFQYFSDIMSFWKDYDHKYYWAAILPVQGKVIQGQSGTGGYALSDGFYMNYVGDIDTKSILKTICHEAVHRWIGSSIKIGNSSFDHMWLGEGFTDYITLYTAVNSDLIDVNDFYEEINKKNLAYHYTSKFKETPNDSIGKMFWTNYEISELPYTRGFIFAFYLDNQIRLASKNKKTIRDFLLDLEVKVSSKERSKIKVEGPLTLEEFIEMGARYLDKDKLRIDIDKYIINGKLIDFKEIELIDAFIVEFQSPYPDKTTSIEDAFRNEKLVNSIGKENAAKQEKVVNSLKELLLTKDIAPFVKNTVDGFTFLDTPLQSLKKEVDKLHATSIYVKSIIGNNPNEWKIILKCNKSNSNSQDIILYLNSDYKCLKVTNVEDVPSIKLKNETKLKDIYSW